MSVTPDVRPNGCTAVLGVRRRSSHRSYHMLERAGFGYVEEVAAALAGLDADRVRRWLFARSVQESVGSPCSLEPSWTDRCPLSSG